MPRKVIEPAVPTVATNAVIRHPPGTRYLRSGPKAGIVTHQGGMLPGLDASLRTGNSHSGTKMNGR